MKQSKTIQVEELTAKINRFLTETAPYKDLIDQAREHLVAQEKSLARDVSAAAKENRLLRIAVIGQVKAGKSSFLNAALFNGEGVLPKAATPMTAALTIIRYAPEVKAEVEFYERHEWESIEKAAAEYQKIYEGIRRKLEEEANTGGLFGKNGGRHEVRPEAVLARVKSQVPEEVAAAREVVEMATKRGLNVVAHLGDKRIIAGVADVRDLMDKLEEYVGANGQFTPLVRSTIIHSNDPALVDVEIIDTPGINDPVVSRGRRTKEYLGQCDVVFMLSRCAHFIDSTDMQLLAQNLPAKGIRDIVLVGTQLDTEMYGEHKKYPDIKALLDNLEIKLELHASDTFEKLKKRVTRADEQEILLRLTNALPPVFISAMAYNIACHFDTPDEEERHFLGLYNKMYTGLIFDQALLRDLSNMSRVTAELDNQKCKKEEIFHHRLEELIKGAEADFRRRTAALREDVGRQLTRIGQEDLKSLQEKEKSVTGRINKGRNNVENSFEVLVLKARRDFELLKTEVDGRKNDYNVKEHTGSYQEEYEVSTSHWYNPFSWGSSETRTRTITYRYASVHEAIDQVEMFVNSSKERLQKAIIEIVNLPRFRADVREAAMSLFDLSDPSFDVDAVAMPVERAVNRITIPSVDFGDRDYTGLITSKFSGGRVTESAVDSLRQAQREAIRAVFSDFEAAVRQKTAEITSSLEKAQTEFVDKLLADIQKDLNTLREQVQDREKVVRRHKELLGILDKWK